MYKRTKLPRLDPEAKHDDDQNGFQPDVGSMQTRSLEEPFRNEDEKNVEPF